METRALDSLRSFYVLRAVVAYAWVAAVALTAPGRSAVAAGALALYAAWDALANWLDLRRNPIPGDTTRQINIGVSLGAAAAMAVGAVSGFEVAAVAFGAWALVAGILQLVVGLRRRGKAKGQLFMVLSGGQSALAGIFFTRMGLVAQPSMADLFPYAAFGATYFLASALWLTWTRYRAQSVRTTQPGGMHV